MKTRVALVTGGSRGIGLGIARALARDGWSLAINGVRAQADVLLLAHDLGYLNPMDYESLTKQINSTFGLLQGLIKSVKKEVGFVGSTVALLIGAMHVAFSHHA